MNNQHAVILIVLLSAVNLSHQANLNTCHERRATDLYGSNGKFLKKVCHVKRGQNYEEANYHCRDNGMELFVIENENVFNAFSTYMLANQPESNFWKNHQGAWINGRRDINGVWHVFAPDQQELDTSFVKWTFGPNYDESCLAVKRQNEFKVTGNRCNQGFYFVCQFDVAAHLKTEQSEYLIDYRKLS